MTRIKAIYMSDLNGLIGINDTQPFHIPEDFKFFKQLTQNHIIVMGRKTYEAIIKLNGKPLKGRRQLILTHNLNYEPEGVDLDDPTTDVAPIHSVAGVLKLAQFHNQPLFIIGGEEIYTLFEPMLDELYHTKVDTWVNLDDKDGHFAYYNPDLSHFTLVDASEIKEFTDSNSNVINYEFLHYQRTTY